MNFTEASFLKAISNTPKMAVLTYTRDEVENIIRLLSRVPPSKKDPFYNKWYRINKRYAIVTIRTSELLYLLEGVSSPFH